MTIMSTLVEQKTHIIYVVAIIIVASVAYHFFSKTPSEIIKTKVETKTEIKIVKKNIIHTKYVYVDKVTEIKKANGDVVTITDHSHSQDKVTDTSKIASRSDDKVTTTEVTKFMKNYSIDVMYPITITDITSPVFNPKDLQAMVGTRIFDFPIFATIGTNGHLSQVFFGARLEF